MPSKTSSTSASWDHPPLGTVIDDGSIELVDVLGVGGYGMVYRAEETFSSSPRSYAVKCLSHTYGQSARQRQLHIREVTLHQIVGAHPNVVSLYRVVEDHRHMFIIMEYAPDHDLFSQILHNCRYLGQDHLIRHVFLQLVDAVEHCHNLGIYHRDLKPENVLCFDNGLRVAITDFGLATTDKVSSELRTGSVYHMSPECQSQSGTYSPMANDVWSLGIILLNLATGRNPWKSATLKDPTFQAYVRDPQHFLPSVLPISQEINAVLVRMLEVDWAYRMTLPELRVAIEEITTFYAEDAVFEGSMARCSWEASMEVDCEQESSEPPAECREEIEPRSRWSSDTDSDIVFASPSTAVELESHCGHPLAQEEASCADDWCASSFITRTSSLFVRPRTPPSSRSLISPCTSDSASGEYSSPPTPGSLDRVFADKARITEVPHSRHHLSIDTDLSPTGYFDDKSMCSYGSSMQTAVNYDCYEDSFFLPNSKASSKQSISMPQSVLLDPSYSSDKDMYSPSVYSSAPDSLHSRYSSRSYYEIATEGRDDRSSTEIHVHPQQISLRLSSSSSEAEEPSNSATPRITFTPPKQFKLLNNRKKTKIFDIFPRSRSPSPPPPPAVFLPSKEDSSLPEPFSAFSFGHTSTDSPLMEDWAGIIPAPKADRGSHTRSRPWFLPGKLFTSMGS